MALKYLEEANRWLGTKEEKGTTANPAIVKFASYTSLKAVSDEIAWCSAFVNYVVETCGDKGTRSAAARSWLTWGRKLINPVPGCVVVLDRKCVDNPNAAHVTFYVGEGTPGFIRCIGGNQGDSVKVSNYSKSSVLGYRDRLHDNE